MREVAFDNTTSAALWVNLLFYCLGPKGCVAEASITTMS